MDDTADNCPATANPDQRDHDADAIGDDCDLCPHLPVGSEGDRDSDGDGVGDACDPRPNVGGDRAVVWQGFYDDADISTWTQFGTWTISGGAARSTAVDSARLAPPDLLMRASVTVGFEVLEAGAVPYVGVSLNGLGPNSHSCGVYEYGGNTYLRVATGTPAVDTVSDQGWPAMFVAGSRFVLTHIVPATAASHACIARQNALTAVNARALGPSASGPVAVDVYRGGAAVDYIFAVEVGP